MTCCQNRAIKKPKASVYRQVKLVEYTVCLIYYHRLGSCWHQWADNINETKSHTLINHSTTLVCKPGFNL